MKRFNLALDATTYKKLLQLLKWLNAASVTEVLRRAVIDLHGREKRKRSSR